MKKKLIINADDFGISSSVNSAIAALFKKGLISSATLMTSLGSSSRQAARLAKKLGLPVGLHFNLTLKNPRYENRRDFETSYVLGRVSRKYIQDELQKQYAFLLKAGLRPTHLDSHQHIHNWPGIFRIVAGFAKAKGLAVRIPEEWPVWNSRQRPKLSDLKQLLRKIFFLVFSKINKLQAFFYSVKTNRNLLSVFALWPRPVKLTEQELVLLFSKAKTYSEYMCHPLVSAAKMRKLTSISDFSVQEYALMTKKSFLAMINRLDLQLINFGGL